MKKVSLRQCVACGEMKDKRSLIRIVLLPDGGIAVDKTGKLNGRGAYICDNPQCADLLGKRKGLDKSFKMKVQADTYASVQAELEQGRLIVRDIEDIDRRKADE